MGSLTFSGGEAHEKPIWRGDCLKRAPGQYADLRREVGRKEGEVILTGGGDTPMHTMKTK